MSKETDFLRAMQSLGVKGLGNQWPPFVLATITEVHTSGGYKLRRVGAASTDSRYYKRVEGQPLSVDDLVLCARVSGSLVILGKLVVSDVLDDVLFHGVLDSASVQDAVTVDT